ncbi:hypothetical protein Pcinc_029151 [Petrolisthes cinctipes]|uniref:Uncharacterized protein n=1 Tax=Petrolisthes cinctipes TaxID=88211 RepID=A0AAE1F1J9_PETCI|nr:hypothetical protein Pcinc_029151 [Petrolisthes cinctipes]
MLNLVRLKVRRVGRVTDTRVIIPTYYQDHIAGKKNKRKTEVEMERQGKMKLCSMHKTRTRSKYRVRKHLPSERRLTYRRYSAKLGHSG